MQATHATARFAIIGLISAFLFGTATPAGKALLGGIPAQALAGLLYLGAALGVLPILVKEGAFRWPWRAGHQSFFLLTGTILLGGILGPVLLLLGLKAARAGSVSLWLNLESVATVILGHFVFREHLTLRGWIAAGGTFAAALLLAGVDRGSGILPAVLVAAGCVCWGFDNHFTALIDGISPAQTTLWKGVVAGAFNLSIGSAVSGGAGPPGMIITALLVGTLSYGLSITLYITAAQGMGATRSQMIFSTAPFFGLLLSVTALGEAFTGMQAIAAGIMSVSLIVLFSEKHEHVHRHDSMSHQHDHRHDEAHHDHEHEGIRPEQKHLHWHEHNPKEHAHRHLPDLHHRHGHEDEDKR
jgi:drug/metabolite transporter (DMT)-like permease